MRGSCNCKSVTFEVHNTPQGASMCHCGQCRRQSGGVWCSAYVETSELSVTGNITWYRSSERAERGFCPVCGSFLFWRNLGETTTSFALGAIDGPTGLTIQKHIFVADKGDYYEIADGLPQKGN